MKWKGLRQLIKFIILYNNGNNNHFTKMEKKMCPRLFGALELHMILFILTQLIKFPCTNCFTITLKKAWLHSCSCKLYNSNSLYGNCPHHHLDPHKKFLLSALTTAICENSWVPPEPINSGWKYGNWYRVGGVKKWVLQNKV